MSEEVTLSPETILLAEVFGKALASIATELKVRGALPPGQVEAAFNTGLSRLRTSSGNSGDEVKRDLIVGHFLRAAAI